MTPPAPLGVREVHAPRQEQVAEDQGNRSGSGIRCGESVRKDVDPDGNPRYRGFIGGKRCVVVVALDEPDVIITVFERERG
jgi:hypothetical protein